MTKTEIDLETSAYSPFNLLTRLQAPEYFIEFRANLRSVCAQRNLPTFQYFILVLQRTVATARGRI
jgi:hypothetical protein